MNVVTFWSIPNATHSHTHSEKLQFETTDKECYSDTTKFQRGLMKCFEKRDIGAHAPKATFYHH